MNICIAGRFPPPIGGVSVYISRRYASLLNESDNVAKLDFSEPFFLLQLVRSKADHYEVNSLNVFVVLAFFLAGKIKRCTFVDHNASRHYHGFKKKLLLLILRRSSGIYVVNPKLTEFYPAYFTVKLISPFVAPDESEYDAIVNNYPEQAKSFINSGKFVVNSAWKYIPNKSGDLYGVGTSLKLLESIPNMRLLLVIGLYESELFPDYVKQLIEKHTKSGRLHILAGQHQLWPVLREKPIFLRLTPTDGDSVSVREALYFSCKTITSDATIRPEGCIIYHYESFENLRAVLMEHL